ncbi:hypothetical protein DIS24_g10555 [Lasiodiplodia hormozganensis]|uniref:GST N-terminal domain-containing protein n=1 Tax=Lasiodiplodia hormozganensis TaxID=869390 RepID=A0AA39XRB3_9PEZI|nr:hypothetical protein DIS24_g10555 [Lasiodiplodia hormozganensis]
MSPLTLWFIPTKLFPRRVSYYLKAKGLPRSLLSSGALKVIPVVSDPATGISQALEGFEKAPPGYTYPLLRVANADKPHGSPTQEQYFITQSMTVIDYLEDAFPASAGYRDLRGETPAQRARARDIAVLTNDMLIATLVYLRHAPDSPLKCSGIAPENVSPGAAVDAMQQVRTLAKRIEGWVREDILERGSLGVAGTGDKVTTADCVLAAAVVTCRDTYGVDLLEGMEALNVWIDRYTKSEWFPSHADLGLVETGAVDMLFT